MISKLFYIFTFYILGYGNEAKATTLETALFYKDHPTLAKTVTVPKTVMGTDEHGKRVVKSGPTQLQEFHGYNRRKKHVELSQEVPFSTNLHVDFLKSSK